MNNTKHTQNDYLFFVRFWKWIRNAPLRQNDNGTIHCGPQPSNMCMPKKCASLTCDGEVVDIALPWLDRTLCNICWTIRPTSTKLFDSMPVVSPIMMIYSQITASFLSSQQIVEEQKFSPVDCNIVFNMVGDPYNYSIFLPCIESWTRALSIDCDK